MTTCEAEKRALNAGNGGHTCMVRSLVSSSIYAKNDMMFIGAMVPKGLTWSLCRTRVHCKKWLNILSPELQLWQWCNVSSPLWQPSMGSVGNATLVEYSNNWILPSVQRSLPLIGHFNHTVITLGLLWYQHKTPARQLVQISSLTILGTPTRSLQLSQHGNFHALMATCNSVTDV